MHTHMHTVPQTGKQVKMEFNEKPGPNTDSRCRAWPDGSILFRSAESTRGNGYKLEKMNTASAHKKTLLYHEDGQTLELVAQKGYGVSLHEVG